MTIGETIKIFRTANNYTVLELSNLCGISRVNLSLFENNTRKVTSKSLKKIARAFNVLESDIIEIRDKSEIENWGYQKTLLEILKLYVK